VELGLQRNPEGSVLYRSGRTSVLLAASTAEGVPDWKRGETSGWLTGEYVMHPRATPERQRGRRGVQDGRATEIARLVGRGLIGRRGRITRPARLRGAARDRAGRTHLARIAQRSALTQRRDPQRKIGPAHAGPADRLDAHYAGAFLDRARVDALRLGLLPPRLALGKHVAAAATREHAEDAKDDGADEIPTNSPRHGADNATEFVNDSSKIRSPAARLVSPSHYG
jgi:hypothetical protein